MFWWMWTPFYRVSVHIAESKLMNFHDLIFNKHLKSISKSDTNINLIDLPYFLNKQLTGQMFILFHLDV